MTAPLGFTLNHVALPSQDIAASVRFYEAFGFVQAFAKRDASQATVLQQMALGSTFVELIQMQAPQASQDYHFGLLTDDIHGACAALLAKGISPDGPIERGISGVDYVFFSDPSGNLIEITAPVP